jgi:hypothetical protein
LHPKKNGLSTFITLNETIMPYPYHFNHSKYFQGLFEIFKKSRRPCNASKLKPSNDFPNFNKLTNEKIIIYLNITTPIGVITSVTNV